MQVTVFCSGKPSSYIARINLTRMPWMLLFNGILLVAHENKPKKYTWSLLCCCMMSRLCFRWKRFINLFIFLLQFKQLTERQKYFRILPNTYFCRYNLPILIIIVNNNGIYAGLDADAWKEVLKSGDPATW